MEITKNKYYLQMLRKELINKDLEKCYKRSNCCNSNSINEEICCNCDNCSKKGSIDENVFGVFGEDNSFVFSKEVRIHSFSRYTDDKYRLDDLFYGQRLSNDFSWRFTDNSSFSKNGFNYYVVIPSKIIPVSYLQNASLLNLMQIQDEINLFLADNPDFVYQVFVENKEELHQKKKIKTAN